MFVRKLIREQAYVRFDLIDLEGNIDEMIAQLENIRAEVKEKHPAAVEIIIKHCYGYEGVEYSTVYFDRWETDGEQEARIEKEARAAEKRRIAKEKREAAKASKISAEEKRDRAEYERLKKKYG